ncbi:MAG: DUF697 domain-containing protein [Myxococcota bacterium]
MVASSVPSASRPSAAEPERDAAIADVIHMSAVAAAATAVQPIPLLDLALLAPVQIVMVQKIGRHHGYELDRKAVLEVLSTFGASLATQSVLLSASKLLPVVGWVVAVPMAYAITHAIGEVADHYFRCGRGVSNRELQRRFRSIFRARRRQHAAGMKNPSLKRRLQDLVDAHEAGLIDEETFRRAKEALLDELRRPQG